jgi:hypothetical protein
VSLPGRRKGLIILALVAFVLSAAAAHAIDGGAKLSLTVPHSAKVNQSYTLKIAGNSGDFKHVDVMIGFSACASTAAGEIAKVGLVAGYNVGRHKAFSKTIPNSAATPGARELCAYLLSGKTSSKPQVHAGKPYTIKN